MLVNLAVWLVVFQVVVLLVVMIGELLCECRAQLQTLRATAARRVRK